MGWRYLLLLWTLGLSMTVSAQSRSQDSVAFQPRGNFYLIYQRDSVGLWQLRELLTPEEYLEKRSNELTHSHFYNQGKTTENAIPPPHKGLGIKTNGYVTMNINNTIIEDNNPSLPIHLRKRSFIEIRPEINTHVQANYGDRLQLDISYDTETMLADRKSRVRLKYLGEQFDMIQRLEAGNVRMESRNPLIDSGQELFGLRGDFLLGPVTLQVMMSRQHSEERKIVVQGGRQLRQTQIKGSDYDFGQHFFLSEFFASKYDTALSDLPIVISDIYIERIEVWISTPRQNQLLPNVEPITAFQGATLSNQPPSSADFEATGIELGSAQRLPSSAYTLNPTLGFISLHAPLAEDQVLAVAYRYRYKGQVYEVGEISENGGRQRVALLSSHDKTPQSPLWSVMMKNGYSLLGVRRNLEANDLKVMILLRDYQSGVERPIADIGTESGRSWMDLFGWDRADMAGVGGNVDGIFDMIEGVTYVRNTGTLFFPYREPMVTVPLQANNGQESGTYPVFTALYSETQSDAQEEMNKDLFILKAEVSGASTQTIALETRDLAPGSVKVEASGRVLSEGIDYTIDYLNGYLTLTSDRAERIEITLQEYERVRRKEKSLIGTEFNWTPLSGLNIGGTLLHYWEDSRRMRVRWGEEALKNTMLGAHASYQRSSQLWTSLFNSWSGLDLKEPISLSAQASYAQLFSGYNAPDGMSDKIVIDDFEQGNHHIDLSYPRAWLLGPLDNPNDRAQFAWYSVDPLLVRDNARHQPNHLAQDELQRCHPLVREVQVEEFYPKRSFDPIMNQAIPMLNLSFYPEERGPYNTDTERLDPTGKLNRPTEMWASIIRPLEINDLESSNYSYIEVWVLDPFSLQESQENASGELYLDIGRLREQIFPELGIYFEGGQKKSETNWGQKADQIPQIYGFDTSGTISIEDQDTGLDGLKSADERKHPRYAAYLSEVERITGFTPWINDPFGNPQSDPAGDDYHFFLDDIWDASQASILQRYKYINGQEGNSIDRIVQGVHAARTWLPDTEDFNRDMIQETEERFLRYRIPISRQGLSKVNPQVIGEQWLNAGSERERWVKIRIPLEAPLERHGTQPTLKDAQAIRLSLTGFSSETHLRLAQFRIISTAWADFIKPIESADHNHTELLIGRLSVEEDSDREPIPYASPADVRRDLNNQQLSLTQEDEQALFMRFKNLAPSQPVAAYREFSLDLRHYEHLELYTHLESDQRLGDGEVELFIRLGHDFTENFYEYRIPLSATPISDYSAYSEQELAPILWPKSNQIHLLLHQFPELKMRRDQSGALASKPFEIPDAHRSDATLSIQGYPTLGEVSAVMIGVRNRSDRTISAEIWVNELSVSGARAMGGKAAQATLNASLGELADLYVDAQYRSAGFGGITSDTRRYELADYSNISLRTTLQLGMLVPERWRLRIPVRYSFDHQQSTPYFDPYNSDLLSKYATGRLGSLDQRQSFQIDELRYLANQENAPFWSPQNLLFRYQLLSKRGYSPEIESERMRHAITELNYNYNTGTQSYVRLNSRWNRLYQYYRYTSGASESQPLSTLQSRWDWIRGLQLRQELIRGLTLSIQSSTYATIREPFEEVHRLDRRAQFDLLTEQILRDILALGTTQSYNGHLELIYRLPSLQKRLLQPLQATLSWRSTYKWDSGSESSTRTLGNRAQNDGYIDLLGRYHLSQLWDKATQIPIQQIDIHFRRTTGSQLAGMLSSAGKALGIGVYERHLSPSIGYMLALTDPRKEIERAERNYWLLKDNGILQPVSYFWRNEFESSLTLTPLKGLQIELCWQNNQQKHTEVTPYHLEIPDLVRGNLQFSTIVTLGKKLSGDGSLTDDFMQSNLLTIRINDGLPSLLSTLPNWSLTYDLTHWHRWLSDQLASIKLRHAYRAFLELPIYHNTPSGSQPYDIQSIVASEEMNPLIGLEIRTKWGLTLEERFIQRHSNTLLTSSERVLQQRDHELISRASYSWSFAPLFHSQLRLLKSFKQSLSLQLNHIYTRTLLMTEQISTGDRTTTQGVLSHNLQLSAEYGLSEAISLRAFYERQQRDPLVSNYNYPYVRTTYGMIVRLQLRP